MRSRAYKRNESREFDFQRRKQKFSDGEAFQAMRDANRAAEKTDAFHLEQLKGIRRNPKFFRLCQGCNQRKPPDSRPPSKSWRCKECREELEAIK